MSSSNAATAENSGINEELANQMRILLESLSEEKYKESADICQSVLKDFNKAKKSNKKSDDSSNIDLRDAIISILIKCWFHLEFYEKIKEWIPQQRQVHALSDDVKFLDYYAGYRLKEYKPIIKKLSSSTKNAGEKHLLAQAIYRSSSGGSADVSKSKDVYHELIDEITNTISSNGGDNTSASVSSEIQEQQVELWTNYLAVLLADSIPYVNVGDVDNTSAKILVESSELLDSSNPNSQFYNTDLAYNLGTYQCFTASGGGSETTTKWLDQANEHFASSGASSNEDKQQDMATILGNRIWSRQWIHSGDADGDDGEIDNKKDMSFANKHGTAVNKMISKFNQMVVKKDGASALVSKIISSVEPDDNWTTLQVRLYWYNRAIVHLRASAYNDCRKSCQSLQKTLNNNTSSSDDSDGANNVAWWNARCDVILAHLIFNEGGKDDESRGKAIALLEKRRDKLSGMVSQSSSSSSSPKLDNASAHIQLQLYQLSGSQQWRTDEKKVQLLEKDLPPSIRSRKAVQATLSSMSGSPFSTTAADAAAADDGEAASTTKADALLSQGEYEKAATMYQELLPSNAKQCTPEEIQVMLRYVQALGHSNPQEAGNVWESLKDHIVSMSGGGTEKEISLSGEELLSKELPKSKSASSKSGNDNKKLPSSQSRPSNDGKNKNKDSKKKSQESVLRRRARQRESYLAEREAKGLYNSSRPNKPNADRWIPKRDRGGYRSKGGSSNAGGSRGAQGSAAAGDARKLDAAARKAAGGASNESGGGGPSTANMKVSSAGGGGRKGGRRR